MTSGSCACGCEDAVKRVEQARKNAQWWQGEIRTGRVMAARDVAALLRDLETAGGEPTRKDRT